MATVILNPKRINLTESNWGATQRSHAITIKNDLYDFSVTVDRFSNPLLNRMEAEIFASLIVALQQARDAGWYDTDETFYDEEGIDINVTK